MTDLEKVQLYSWNIQFIKNPSLEVQLAVVKKNGLTLQYISEPDFEVQIAAVKQNIDALNFVTQKFKELYPEYFL